MQEELKKLKENLSKLEELTNRLGYLLREIDQAVGGKNGQTGNDASITRISNGN